MIHGISHTETRLDAELLALLRRRSIGHVELRITSIDRDAPFGNYFHRAELARAVRDEGVTLSLHSFAGVNLAEKIGRIRETAMEIVREQLDFGEAIGAMWLTVHLGTCGFGRRSPKKRERLALGAESVLRLLERTAGYRIAIALENVERLPDAISKCYLGDSIDDFAALMPALVDDRVGVLFDIGHANLDPETPPEDFLAAVAGRTIGLHLHANDGRSDQHAPITDAWLAERPGLVSAIAMAGRSGAPLIVEHHSIEAAELSNCAIERALGR